jgi:hypothetical protein
MPGLGFGKYLIFILISKKMKKEKMSLKSVKNVLSRAEMKKIMAGSGSGSGCLLYQNNCTFIYGGTNPCCAGLKCYTTGGPWHTCVPICWPYC